MRHAIGNFTVDIMEDSLIDIVHFRALYQPDKIAFRFLADRNDERINVTFSELDRNVRNLASILQKSALRGERAILLYPSGKDYVTGFLGCLFSGIIAVPAYPPDPTRLNNTLKRLQVIIENSQARVALTTSHIYNTIRKLLDYKKAENESQTAESNPRIEKQRKDLLELRTLAEKMMNSLIWIQTDLCESGHENEWIHPAVKSDDIAYLQYTSGSTGSPNGVMISHRNIMVNSKMIASSFETSEDHEGVIWLPIYHDMGLIGGILQPIFAGFSCTLMSPLSFLAWPNRWLKEISNLGERPVVSGGPNFAYELCTKRITSEQISSLDLSRWQLAFSGAEPVRWKTIEEFSSKFAPAGFKKEAFYPCYGLAEATLFVTGVKRKTEPVYFKPAKKALERNIILEEKKEEENEGVRLVSSGYPWVDGRLAIVDPETKEPCSQEKVGEIWFSSNSVAKGYWNKPLETSNTFNQNIKGESDNGYLRTGDLGFIRDGQLYITGRLKDVIIIRGKNHYPQDIEYTVEKSHSAIRPSCVAAFSVDKDNEETLAVVLELTTESNVNFDEVFSSISNMISTEHDLQVGSIALIKQKTILKTSSGKIQRNAIRQAYLTGQLEIVKLWQASVSKAEEATHAKVLQEAHVSSPKDIKLKKISEWLINNLAAKLKLHAAQIDIDRPFSSYGIDSVMAVEMASDLENYLGRKISSTIVWEYSTINKLAQGLSSELQEDNTIGADSEETPFKEDQIAVIGMACRFPGGANSPEEFWRLLEEGKDGITVVPEERWKADEYYSEDVDAPGKMSTRFGGFINDIDKFDAKFFGVSPREAVQMDPQQRLLLEILWEAMENASIIPEKMAGSKTGVFIGISNHDYSQFQFGNFNVLDVYSGTGNSFSISANRISYLFDLHGPSVAVDTACSSSLVASHLAMQSLLRKESEMAIVGGVNAIITPDVSIALSKGRMLSPDGHCKTFDASANGYVRSEGCGVLILKRLSRAVEDGNKILAVLKGSAVNQDGRSNGLTAPSKSAQMEVIKDALRDARVTIDDVGYIETHGTGTILGDPIETEAISEIFKSRIARQPLVIGSVKSNIGHLESAAGVAGLIKVILMLNHKAIPANLNFKKLNPHIQLNEEQIRIASENMNWESLDKKRIACISSFGFGGVNAHLVVEEYAEEIKLKEEIRAKADRPERPYHILAISAKDDTALKALAVRYEKELNGKNNKAAANICYSANTGRSHFSHRLIVTGESASQLKDRLEQYTEGKTAQGVFLGKIEQREKPKLAFLFTGQGSQYVNMSKLLYDTHPIFKETVDRCNEILRKHLNKPILEVIFNADETSDEINNTIYTQPAFFTIEYALAKLWISWGIKPDYLIGHSIGEYTAAAIAEVFSLEDALMLVAARGRLMQSLPKNGLMAAVFADENTVGKVLKGFEDRISISGINGPANTVISGEAEAIKEVIKLLQEKKIHLQQLTVSHAFHSLLMEPILDEFEAVARNVQYTAPKIPVISNLTGDITRESQIPDSFYWRDHIKKAVLFYKGVKTLERLKTDVFLEIGPHATLTGLGQSCLPDSKALWVTSLKRGQNNWQTVTDSLAKLYLNGLEVDWREFDRCYNRKTTGLPNYPFKKERYWVEAQKVSSASSAPDRSAGAVEESRMSILVHQRIFSPALKEAVVYSSRFTGGSFSLLDDHRILGISIMPMAGYIEMISAVMKDLYIGKSFVVSNMILSEAMIISPEKQNSLQIILNRFNDSEASFQVYSYVTDKDEKTPGEPLWKLNAEGEVHLLAEEEETTAQNSFGGLDISLIEKTYGLRQESESFYENLQQIGFEHGRTYRILKQIYSKDKEAIASCSLVNISEAGHYSVHPCLLDAGIQLFLATFTPEEVTANLQNEIYLPSELGKYRKFKEGVAQFWVKTVRKDSIEKEKEKLSCDIFWYDETGDLAAEAIDFKFKRTTVEALSKYFSIDLNSFLYKTEWIREDREAKADDSSSWYEKGNWMIFSGISNPLGEHIIEQIESEGSSCLRVKQGESFRKNGDRCFEIRPDSMEDFKELFREVFSQGEGAIDHIIYLWGLECNKGEKTGLSSVETAEKLCAQAPLYLIQNILSGKASRLPALWLVTSEAQEVLSEDRVSNFSQSLLWALGKVLSNEHPEIMCTMLDTDKAETKEDAQQIIRAIQEGNKERLLALRKNLRYLQRLKRQKTMDQFTAKPLTEKTLERLEISQRGSLDQLFINKIRRPLPRKGEVEIEVRASGLNFRDVINALGLYPGDAGLLGGECSGVVSALGGDVEDLHIGDSVMGIAPGSFSTYALTKAQLVVKKPDGLDYLQSATVPIVFLTAHYGLNKLARMKARQRVLIHSASGGVGLAAIQLAQLTGAEVYATAGSEEKREYLRSLGVKYIMNSRDLKFADEVMEYTEGKGVDIVLNSLNGEYIPKGLSILSKNGSFLEIGKVGIWNEESVRAFRDDVSYFKIALDSLSESYPALVQTMLQEIKQLIESGKLRALKYQSFNIKNAESAFRLMMKAKHIGKVVIEQDFEKHDPEKQDPEKMHPGKHDQEKHLSETDETIRIDPKGTYLITGGTGALGIEVANWLSEKNAGQIVLLGFGETSQAALRTAEAIGNKGTKVTLLKANVADEKEMGIVFSKISSDKEYTLKGIIHAAGILDDAILINQSWENFRKVMDPKIRGALNIYNLSKEFPLDFVLYFSSVAPVLGSPGQANYATANLFLDCFHHKAESTFSIFNIEALIF